MVENTAITESLNAALNCPENAAFTKKLETFEKNLMRDMKFHLKNHAEFKKAWSLLLHLGYKPDIHPETCAYLYAYKDGRLTVDYFDVDGADLEAPGTASYHFKNHPNPEQTLDYLELIYDGYFDLVLIQVHRPVFEANYIHNGGSLAHLRWEECADGSGSYQPDWSNISDSEITDSIAKLADHVTGCLSSWIECVKVMERKSLFKCGLSPDDYQKLFLSHSEFLEYIELHWMPYLKGILKYRQQQTEKQN